jgi:hypothetical protein
MGKIYKCNTKVVRYEVLTRVSRINPLNIQLNPICHLLALLGAHHILHINRIRVKDSNLLEYYIVLMGKQLPKSWRNILLLSSAQP